MADMITGNIEIHNWIFLAIAAVFLLLGIGILAGLILPDNSFLAGGIRILIGVVLTLYGLARGVMILSSMFPGNRGFSAVDYAMIFLAVIFILFGLGLLTGLILSSVNALTGINRPIMGGALTLYGIWQGIRIVRKLKGASPADEEG
jgi:hypothetical protein